MDNIWKIIHNCIVIAVSADGLAPLSASCDIDLCRNHDNKRLKYDNKRLKYALETDFLNCLGRVTHVSISKLDLPWFR